MPKFEVLDPNQFQVVENASQAPQQPQYEVLNESQFEELPDYANGASPDSPLNESPLSVVDRLKLAAGNDVGRIDFLKSKFEDVTKDEDGELLVKDKGAWKRVDEKDSWELSKDLADIVPQIASMGLQIGTDVGLKAGAAALTGTGVGAGAGIALGAASTAIGAAAAEKARITMGRLAGTYKASEDEELRDIGMETLLNLGGYGIGLGVKPTVKVIGQGLERVGASMKGASDAAKSTLATWVGATTGAGTERAMTLIDNAAEVGAKLKKLPITASPEVVQNELKGESVQALKSIARQAPEAMQTMWNGLKTEVLKNVDDSFKFESDDVLKSIYKVGVDRGLLSAKTVEGAAIESGEDLFKHSAKAIEVSLKPVKEILQQSPELALSDEVMGLATKFYNQVDKLKALNGSEGKLAASKAMSVRKALNDLVFEFNSQATDMGAPQLSELFTSTFKAFDDTLKPALDTASKGGYSNMLAKWHASSVALQPVLTANRAAIRSGNDAAYETLLNSLVSRGGANVVKKGALDQALKLSQEYLPTSQASKIVEAYKNIFVNDAASAFAPVIRPGLIGTTALAGGAGALATGNAGFALPALATGVMSSPRLNSAVTRAAIGVGHATKTFVQALPMKDKLRLLQDPRLTQALFVNSINSMQAPQQVSDQLMSTVPSGQQQQ